MLQSFHRVAMWKLARRATKSRWVYRNHGTHAFRGHLRDLNASCRMVSREIHPCATSFSTGSHLMIFRALPTNSMGRLASHGAYPTAPFRCLAISYLIALLAAVGSFSVVSETLGRTLFRELRGHGRALQRSRRRRTRTETP